MTHDDAHRRYSCDVGLSLFNFEPTSWAMTTIETFFWESTDELLLPDGPVPGWDASFDFSGIPDVPEVPVAPPNTPTPEPNPGMRLTIVEPGHRFPDKMAEMEENNERVRIERPRFETRTKLYASFPAKEEPEIKVPPVDKTIDVLKWMISGTRTKQMVHDKAKQYRNQLVGIGGTINRRWNVVFDAPHERFVFQHPFKALDRKKHGLGKSSMRKLECYSIHEATAEAIRLADQEKLAGYVERCFGQ